jgi:GSH-dependent disulfide-bond oxidoreductase
MEHPINRFAMETKRLLHVLDTQLGKTPYVAGDHYTIADMAIWPWYDAGEFLSVHEYRGFLFDHACNTRRSS